MFIIKICILDILQKIFPSIYIYKNRAIRLNLDFLRNWIEILKILLQRTYSLAVFKKKTFTIIEYIQNEYSKHCSVIDHSTNLANWFQQTDPLGSGIPSLASSKELFCHLVLGWPHALADPNNLDPWWSQTFSYNASLPIITCPLILLPSLIPTSSASPFSDVPSLSPGQSSYSNYSSMFLTLIQLWLKTDI